jgi:hypothetical protein
MKKHYMVVCHKIRDYAQWKRTFDKYIEPLSRKFGLGEVWVCRSADDANEIIVSATVEDLDRAREFAKSPDLKAAMKEAGVTKETGLWFLDELFQVSALVGADMFDAELG